MLHPGILSAERKACPRRVSPSRQSRGTGLPCPQAEEVSELVRHPKAFETDCPIGWHRGIAPQPLGPREPKARPLCPRQDRRAGTALTRCPLRLPHLDALVSHKLHTGVPVYSAAPILRSRSGAEPTGSGCNSTLTWRSFAVALPFHWHCSRRGQGRQLRMLAPYTTRRLPSASWRCSCGSSFWSAGHRSVPSGWRAKSWPAKRPAFQGKPT